MSSIISLTHQQRQFVLNYVRGMNGTDAVISAYSVNNRRTAAVIASQNLRKLNISTLIDSLSSSGPILENSVRVISEGLGATKGVKGLPDWSSRLKASKQGLDLLKRVHGENR